MGGIRNFTGQWGEIRSVRAVDNDAPQEMRQELLAVVYGLLPLCPPNVVSENNLYYGIEQMLGVQAAGNPMAGFRQRLGRDLGNAPWARVYDVISWLWTEFQRAGAHTLYRDQINRVLAAHGVVWEVGDDGRLHRTLPPAAQAQFEAAISELRAPAYAAAMALFKAAQDAYDGRPRRDRDACANVFDTLESVTKQKYAMPNATFGQVIAHIRNRALLNEQIAGMLEAINTARNRNFGHGMAAPFPLTGSEVDFVYLACVGAILLFTRMP